MRAGRQTRDGVAWLFFACSVSFAAIHLGIGAWVASAPAVARQFLLLGVLALVVPGLFLTRYWQPVLYVVGALVTCVLGVVWLFSGASFYRLGALAGVPALGVLVFGAYLFVREESRVSRSARRARR